MVVRDNTVIGERFETRVGNLVHIKLMISTDDYTLPDGNDHKRIFLFLCFSEKQTISSFLSAIFVLLIELTCFIGKF